jgi:uncharacterized membrane protein (UPF0182 family)
MRVPTAEGRRRPLGIPGWLIGLAILIIVLLLSLRGLARFYTDYLWFKDVGYSKTWRSLLGAKAIPALIFSTAFFVVMLANLIVADRIAPRYRGTGPEDEIIERYRGYVAPYAGRVRVLVALFFAIIMGSGVSAQWQNWILFANAKSFHVKDPQFHKDVGFYVFKLPFLQFAAGWVFAALLVILIVSAVFHYLNGGIRLQSPFQRVTPQVKVHISVLLALMALTKTAQYYLAQFSLTTSTRGFVDGATYTDVHAQLPAYRLLMLISVAAAVLFVINIWRRGWVFPIIAVGLWGFISIVIGTIYPAAIQRVTVQPNELAREQKYISRNITATRAAFNLDQQHVATEQFQYSPTLNPADVHAENQTLNNVRLYDPLPAQDAFKITQELFPFYSFSDVDVDRYKIGDENGKPTLASVRELDLAHLPDQSWTNQHLIYTHGYGAVASAADEVAGDSPSYVLSGIPPTGDLQLSDPYTGVYFGEDLGGYAVVDTKVAEQEAGVAGNTKPTKYAGQAGVKVSSFFRKAALALRFGDWNLFVSGQVTSNSRVIYIRDILQRAQMAAPFLKFDADPYPVILNGRILWVMDAYTTTNNYPYSQSIHPADLPRGSGLDTDFNYVRNSVKVTIDAYDGDVNYYIVDPSDPIVKAYSSAFPELFKSADKMPPGLRDHWRYPEDIFRAQTEQYSLYHMTDPVQFFNKQDIWDIAPSPDVSSQTPITAQVPSGNNGGRNTTLPASGSPIDPLYLSMHLPQQPVPQEFALQRSFTPRRKANLTAFVFARSDGPNYGQMVVYQVPDTSVPSPAQAATQMESDQVISRTFTLLDQANSKVVRGNVQLLPIGNAIVYLRPIWILGQGSQTFPRYRFVAVSTGDRSVLANNVSDAINALLNGTTPVIDTNTPGTNLPGQTENPGGTTTPTTTPGSTAPPANLSPSQLLSRAQTEFAAANQALTKSPPDFGAYGQSYNAAVADVNAALAKLNATPAPASTTTTTKGR